MATREAIAEALFERLSAIDLFKTKTRRNLAPSRFDASVTPALVLVEHTDDYVSKSSALPATKSLLMVAILYFDAGQDLNVIPSTSINDGLDAIDAALVADSLQTGRCTLGGLVQSVTIEGSVKRSPGDVTGKSLALVPIRILIP